MKRQIKFRGKSLNNGEWFYGNLFIGDVDGRTHISTTKRGCLNIDPDTVGQFTGLLDKNGKEIYEGDILLVYEVWHGETGKVKIYNEVGIKDGCFGYIGEVSGELLPFCDNKVTEEIAGNIHDNHELLKGGKECKY